ncbi:MAG: inositol monophosphatase [Dehalococcoidia bacterium]|nr:inositol monophosphatase [Dehalococcoidia bacterium]
MVDLPSSVSGRGVLEIAEKAARQAGIVIRSNFHVKKEVAVKGKSNLVTQVDVLAERVILDVLYAEYPSCTILSEETNSLSGLSGYTWIVDPLDGTNNFVFGIPFLCVTLALTKDDDVLFGLTYDPLRDECFYAQAGFGAFLNGERVSVSSRASLESAILGFDIGYEVKWGEEVFEMARFLRPEVHSLRVMGSAALSLAYVACGRLDLYFHKYLYPWDVASGILIVREAGGVVSDWTGCEAKPSTRQIIGANKELSREFLRWVAGRR